MVKIYHFILLFFIVFNFRVPVLHNSIILALFIMVLALLLNSSYLTSFLSLIKTKYFFRILIYLFFLILWTVIFVRLQGTYDYTLLIKFIFHLISIVTLITFLSILSCYRYFNSSYIMNLLFSAFALQAIIQIMSGINHDFFDFIQFFHNNSEQALYVMKRHMGLRGGALAGDLFFSLSIAYGLVFFLYIKKIIDTESFSLKDSLYLILYMIGMFTSARIGYVGIILGFVYFVLAKKVKLRSKLKSFFKFFIYIVIVVAIVYILLPSNLKELLFDKLLPYAFEFIYSYMNNGEFATSSTEHLTKDMFIYPSLLVTWIVGEGRMIGMDGFYYLHTDAGYSRILFYSGIYGFVMLLVYQLMFFMQRSNISNNVILQKNYLKTVFLVIAYILIVNIKGLALGTTISINIILILVFSDIRKYTRGLSEWKK